MSWRRVRTPRKEYMTDKTGSTVKTLRENHDWVAGIDEAGWGPIAGPLVAACVVFPKGLEYPKFIKDSKKLSAKRRTEALAWTLQHALYWNVLSVEATVFSDKGAGIARDSVFRSLVSGLEMEVEKKSIERWIVIIDGDYIPKGLKHSVAVIKADVTCPEVSAASILAKVIRDEYMMQVADQYPEFDWKSNKGYATNIHMDALKKFGATPLHRFNIKKVKEAKLYGSEADRKDQAR